MTLFRFAVSAILLVAGPVLAQQTVPVARYQVRILEAERPRIEVHAVLPSNGATLIMATSRPGDVPELADAGWPALVRNLRVTEENGKSVAVASNGAAGWKLSRPVAGSVVLDYQIDYAPLAARRWPAVREAAFADAEHLMVVGRSLFIATPMQFASDVCFALPRHWQAVVPWPKGPGKHDCAAVAATNDLMENLLVFSRRAPVSAQAGGFQLKVVTFGHWQPVQSEVKNVLDAALPQLTALIGFEGRADYLVVLLPQPEHGGESFRASFAMTTDTTPSRGNRGDWGGTIAHEVFHYWNGWRLQGADYPSSQWFQEGFTEYASNLALVSGGLIDEAAFRGKLATHVMKYQKLATPLDAPGTHKGPPLYGGGALVAFTFDTLIRAASDGRRGLGDMLRALWRNSGEGARPYAWADIQSALEATAPGDWAGFERSYIHGGKPLPLSEAFARVGLRKVTGGDGAIRVEPDPTATKSAQELGRALMGASGPD